MRKALLQSASQVGEPQASDLSGLRGPRMLDLSNLPAHLDRTRAAELITHLYFPISRRTLERWPIRWRNVNGKAIASTADLVAEAQRRFEQAPVLMGGNRSSAV